MHEGDGLGSGPDGEAQARARVNALFEGFNRLTPAELARIGLLRRDADHRQGRLDIVEEAAAASGRSRLLGEVRKSAVEFVLTRYGEGTLNPTWVGLNWGINGGAADDRAAIASALADAASAAVVQDLVAADVAEDLSIDAEHVLGLATGAAYEGALSRHLDAPAAVDLDDPPGRKVVVYGGSVVGGFLVFLAGMVLVTPAIGILGGLVFAIVVIVQGRRPPSEHRPRRRQ